MFCTFTFSWILRIIFKSPGLHCKSLYQWSHLAHHLKYVHMCSYMCKHKCDYSYVSIDIHVLQGTCRGQKTTSGLGLCLAACLKQSILFSGVHARHIGPQFSRDSPVSPSHLASGVQGWRYRLPFHVRWFLDIQTHACMASILPDDVYLLLLRIDYFLT